MTSTMKRVLQPLRRFRPRENPSFAAKTILDISPSVRENIEIFISACLRRVCDECDMIIFFFSLMQKSSIKSRVETAVAEETIKEARKSDEKLLTSSSESTDRQGSRVFQ